MANSKAREIEEFLYQEAVLLDSRKYEEWLALFTDDSYYWIPARQDDFDPKKEVSITYDNRAELGERVARLLHPAAHCQTPPSRTRHLITNISHERLNGREVKVYSNLALFESRLGKQRLFGGCCEHKLCHVSGKWSIASKKIILINNDGVFSNITFLF